MQNSQKGGQRKVMIIFFVFAPTQKQKAAVCLRSHLWTLKSRWIGRLHNLPFLSKALSTSWRQEIRIARKQSLKYLQHNFLILRRWGVVKLLVKNFLLYLEATLENISLTPPPNGIITRSWTQFSYPLWRATYIGEYPSLLRRLQRGAILHVLLKTL
jgi:hypothetical protein